MLTKLVVQVTWCLRFVDPCFKSCMMRWTDIRAVSWWNSHFVYMNDNTEKEVELYEVNSAWWKLEDEKLKCTHTRARTRTHTCVDMWVFHCASSVHFWLLTHCQFLLITKCVCYRIEPFKGHTVAFKFSVANLMFLADGSEHAFRAANY
jgi:hypothetical protein